MKLFTLEYINIYYDEKLKLLEYHWKKNSENLTDEKYKQTIEEFIKITRTFEPSYLIGNLTNQNFVLSAEIWQWIIKVALIEFFNSGIKKIAFINSQYTFAKSIYKTLLENFENIHFFADREQALKWIMEK